MSARDDAAAIIEALRSAREARGWSPERVAMEARNRTADTLSGMTIRRAEAGKRWPTLPSVLAWSRALGVSLAG